MPQESSQNATKNNRRWIIAAVAVVCAIALSAGFLIQRTIPPPVNQPAMVFHGQRFTLMIARTEADQEKGLGGIPSMPEDRGMAFPFDRPGAYGFWMKGMLFPLDIIWLYKGQVIAVKTLPAPIGNQAPAQFQPIQPADVVIELNAGTAQRIGLVPGSTVTLEGI